MDSQASKCEDGSRKRSRKEYMQSSKKPRRDFGQRELAVGMRGFVVTAGNFKSGQACREAMSMIGQYIDDNAAVNVTHKGGDNVTTNTTQNVEDSVDDASQNLEAEPGSSSEDEDVEAALKSECQDVRQGRKQLLKKVKTPVQNVGFISLDASCSLRPDELLYHVLDTILKEHKCSARFAQRILPVHSVCKAFTEEISTTVLKLVCGEESVMKQLVGTDESFTYAVAFKARYNNNLKRTAIIDLVAKELQNVFPSAKVNLSAPDVTVLVEVIQTVCCIGLMRNYERMYKRCSIHELVKQTATVEVDVAENGAVEEEKTKTEEKHKETTEVVEVATS